MSNLYGLFIGINDYASPNISRLNGCENDVKRVVDYMQFALGKDRFRPEVLLSKQATKAAVVDAILAHLSKAGPEDTMLLHYSGHGCQEMATEEFPNEQGGKLQALVCHDSLASSTTLSDKELRYLLFQVAEKTKARLIVVTDSCHSGGVTRDISQAQKRLGPVAPKRKWDQFVFHNVVDPEALRRGESLDKWLPQARHIHFAACDKEQSAYELPEGGIFTTSMINVLKNSQGAVSFYDLNNRLRALARRRFDQTPSIYEFIPGKNKLGGPTEESWRYTTFLEGTATSGKAMAGVSWDETKKKWVLDRGIIHHLPPTGRAGSVKIDLLNHEGKEVGKASVVDVFVSNAFIQPDNGLSNTEDYQARIEGLYADPLQLFLTGDPAGVKALEAYFQENAQTVKNNNLELVQSRVESEYCIVAGPHGLAIVNSRDNADAAAGDLRPVCATHGDWSHLSCAKLLQDLATIAHWHFVRDIENPDPKARLDQDIAWEFRYARGLTTDPEQPFTPDEPEQIFNPDQAPDPVRPGYSVVEVVMPKPASDDQIPMVRMRLRIQNRSQERAIHTGMVYMSQLFEVNTDLLDTSSALLPGEVVWGFGDEGVEYVLDQYISDFNWEDETFYVKLFLSTQPLELTDLQQAGLEAPEKGQMMKDGTRGIIARKPKVEDGWVTKMLEVRLKNPWK